MKEMLIWLGIGKSAVCMMNINTATTRCMIQMNFTSFSLVNFVNECSMKIFKISNPYLWWIINMEQIIEREIIYIIILIIINNVKLILLNISKLNDIIVIMIIGIEPIPNPNQPKWNQNFDLIKLPFLSNVIPPKVIPKIR